ncbi:MAG: hypothetical protein CMP22_07265 [Rickettsiales bacterium]|nr:hypothetical protein [Rickettsiales bacterium]
MSLTKDRDTKAKEAKRFYAPVAASTTIYKGALVARDASGNLVPGAVATTLKKAGVAVESVDNTGSAGAVGCHYETGCFAFGNSTSTDEITKADIGNDCYIVDDETVAKTSGTNTRSIAGEIVDVDDYGVWVLFK